jgi:3'-phosphoadenosine 5'-phosphosulfate sulfotransferase (PAPS reductase)/FAD synthetase
MTPHSTTRQQQQNDKPVRHILSLSGGKDSTALALYMKDKVPNMEYVFCDTDKELDETYDYLKKLQVFLNKPIVYLKAEGYNFDDLLEKRNGYLPSPQARWCTELLKIKPFEKYVGENSVVSYIGIRADEPHRKGYISTKPNIKARFPFIEDGIRHVDVIRILNQHRKLGLPSYYEWRSRSGCYFCFYQQRREWVGLLERHPELFEEAKKYEKVDPVTGQRYTWVDGESLEELAKPERIRQIKKEYEQRQRERAAFKPNTPLHAIFGGETTAGCVVCAL